MTVQELLDELRINVLRDNSGLLAGDSDRLWSDATLVSYINDAYRRFARNTLMIRDQSTAAVTQIALSVGVTLYPLHTSILSVLSARYNLDSSDLPRAGHVLLDSRVLADPLYFDASQLGTLAPGAPKAFSTDEGVDPAGPQQQFNLRVYPAPSATEDGNPIYMRVARLPLAALTLDAPDAQLEVPEDYHLDLLDWAAYRALSNKDVDAADGPSAKEFRDRFEKLIEDVKREMRRKLFAPQGFSFGGGAFSYQR